METEEALSDGLPAPLLQEEMNICRCSFPDSWASEGMLNSHSAWVSSCVVILHWADQGSSDLQRTSAVTLLNKGKEHRRGQPS